MDVLTDPRTKVITSTRLWSEEVGVANAGAPPLPVETYKFQGRIFTERQPNTGLVGYAPIVE